MDASPSKRIWLVPLVFAGLVAVFGWWCDTRLRQTLETKLKAELTATIEANVTALEIWMNDQMVLATALATEPAIRKLALRSLQIEDANPTNPAPATSGLANPSRLARWSPEARELDRSLRHRTESVGYTMAHVVGTNFTIVGGSLRGRGRRPENVLEHHIARYAELFSSGKPVVITPFKPPAPTGPGGPGGPGGRDGPGFGPRGNEGGPRGPRWESRREPASLDDPPPAPGTNPDAGSLPDSAPSGAPPARPPTEARRGPLDNPFDSGPPLPGDFGRFRRGDFTLMQVAAPIRDDHGIIHGALSLVVDPDKEFSRMLSVARSGRSGETYAFDAQGLLISRSRFDDQLRALGLLSDQTDSSSALTLRLGDPGLDFPKKLAPDDTNNPARPLTGFVAAAVAGGTGVQVVPTRDYRGVPVVGAWRWLPERGFGVVTQIDASEAYQPLRVLNFLFLILFLLVLLAAVALLLASFANVAWRKRVTEAELRLKQLGQYTLEERIGEGGMGVVYRARHALLRRDTAVKLLLPDRANPDAIGRFEREVCLTCRLTHPNTIQVYDYGRTPDGIFYYAMEFLRGLNLQQLVHRAGPQPEGRVVHILVQICEALAEAHALGLVHRDIKPANIFLCHRGGIPDFVKVLDFGLVREIHRTSIADAHSTAANLVAGTPSFMPPEALDNPGGTDPRSDLYSLGALGYFILTGERVFEAENFTDLIELHAHADPIPPSLRSDNPVSPELDALLLRCLAKDPDQRPQSAGELRSLLAATPHADEWTEAARVEWWTQLRADSAAQPSPDSQARAGAAPVPVPSNQAALAIDFAGRQDASTVVTPLPIPPPRPPRS